MTILKHVGIYVDDIEKESIFYERTFNMKVVSEKSVEKNELLDELFDEQNVEIITKKLITQFGCEKKTGDMVELIKVKKCSKTTKESHGKINDNGRMHIAIGVDDINETYDIVAKNGGNVRTKINDMKNGRLCGFVTDPEGNWIELIQ